MYVWKQECWARSVSRSWKQFYYSYGVNQYHIFNRYLTDSMKSNQILNNFRIKAEDFSSFNNKSFSQQAVI